MGRVENNFRKIRQKKKLSLEQVSKDTKIHPKILKALEDGEFEKIPSPIYTISFIKKYASYLGIDPHPIIERYNSIYKTSQRQKLYIKEKKLGLDYIKIFFIIKAVLILLLAIVIIYLVASFIRNAIHLRNFKQQVAINKQIAREESKTVPAKTPEVKNIVKKSIPLILTIEAKDEVWIQIKADGKKIFQNVLSKGMKEKWEAWKNFEIWTGKAEKIEIYLNDKKLNLPRKGVVKGILITRKGLKLPK